MSIKLTLVVDDDVPDLLTTLAEGERKRGQWLTNTVRGLSSQTQYQGDDLHIMRMLIGSLAGQVKHQDARISQLERTAKTNT